MIEEGIDPKWVRPSDNQWDRLIRALGKKELYIVSAVMKDFYDPIVKEKDDELTLVKKHYYEDVNKLKAELEDYKVFLGMNLVGNFRGFEIYVRESKK